MLLVIFGTVIVLAVLGPQHAQGQPKAQEAAEAVIVSVDGETLTVLDDGTVTRSGQLVSEPMVVERARYTAAVVSKRIIHSDYNRLVFSSWVGAYIETVNVLAPATGLFAFLLLGSEDLAFSLLAGGPGGALTHTVKRTMLDVIGRYANHPVALASDLADDGQRVAMTAYRENRKTYEEVSTRSRVLSYDDAVRFMENEKRKELLGVANKLRNDIAKAKYVAGDDERIRAMTERVIEEIGKLAGENYGAATEVATFLARVKDLFREVAAGLDAYPAYRTFRDSTRKLDEAFARLDAEYRTRWGHPAAGAPSGGNPGLLAQEPGGSGLRPPGADPGAAPVASSGTAIASATAFVVDVSGSMNEQWSGGTRLAAAKSAVTQLLDLIALDIGEMGRHQAGLITFADGADTRTALTANWTKLTTDVQALRSSGATNLGAGLTAALDLLKGAVGQKIIVVLSDGQSNRGLSREQILSGPASEAARTSVKIYTVGIGEGRDLDEALLISLAKATNAAYYHARNADQLLQIYRRARHQAVGNVVLEKAGLVGEGETTPPLSFTVADATADLHISLSWPGSELDVVLRDPGGRLVDGQYPAATAQRRGPHKYVLIQRPTPGAWTVSVRGKDIPGGSTTYHLLGSVRRPAVVGSVMTGGAGPFRPRTQWAPIVLFLQGVSILALSAVTLLIYRRRSSRTTR